MLDDVSIGVKVLKHSVTSYDGVFEPLRYVRVFANAFAVGYARRGEQNQPFTIGLATNSFSLPHEMHIALAAGSRASVSRFHERALQCGATSDGARGLHPEYGDGYFAAFTIDPDGYRIEAVHHQ